MLVVLALGGNALLQRGQPMTEPAAARKCENCRSGIGGSST